MRKSSKKSTVKSKKGKRKNPLKKYQTGSMVTPTVGPTGTTTNGFGLTSGGLNSATLGSDSYLSSPTSTTNTYNSQFGDSFSSPYGSDFSSTPNSSYSGLDAGLNTDPIKPRTLTEFNVDENTNLSQTARNQANVMNAEYKADPRGPSRKEKNVAIAEGAMAAITPGLGFITEAMKKKTIDDPNRYYNRKTKAKLESYNRKISAAKSASSVGQGIMATGAVLASTGVGAIPGAIVTGVGGIVTGVSEAFAGGYRGDQKEVGAAYDLAVANRQKTERRAKAQREKNEEINQQQYFQQAPSPNAGISIGRDGGMMKYQVGGLKREASLEEVDVMDPAMDVLMNGGIRKYMGGGYTKVNGPSHEDGGVAMDLDADGVVDSELEGGEIIEEMKHGGNASKKYIWSDHLKTGGISFAKKFEQERKRGATPRRIEKLRVEQELAAKRDPSKLYAKYGGMMKYQKGGYRKVPDTEPIGNDLSAKNAIKRLYYGAIDPKGESNVTNQLARLMPQTLIANTAAEGINKYGVQPYFKLTGNKKQLQKEAERQAVIEEQNKELQEYKKLLESEGVNPLFKTGGLMKYRGGGSKGFSMVQPAGTFDDPVPFVSPFASKKEERAFQDYANAQEAGVTNGYGWGPRSDYAYSEYGDQYAKAQQNFNQNVAPITPITKSNIATALPTSTPTVPVANVVQTPFNIKKFRQQNRQQNLKDLKGGFNEYAGGAAALLGAGARAAALGSIDPSERPPSMSARDVKAEKVFIDRAKDLRVGARESELINAKRSLQMSTGPKNAALNAARMVSLRAQEEAAQNVYDQNRQASSTEQLANQKAQLEADMTNQSKDLKTSESISRIMDKVIDTRRNQTIAGGEIAAQSMKDFQSWKANQDLTRAMEGDRNVMSNFYNNNYPAFARKFKKSNPNATALEINQAFLASV